MFVSIGAQSDSGGDAYDRSPWGNFYFEPIPYRGGLSNLSGDVALQLIAVYACVRVIAETIAALPFVLYREAADGAKTAVRDHWLYMLMKRPNRFQSGFAFREMLSGHCALRGNAFAVMSGNSNGVVTEMIPLHPDRIGIEMLSDTTWRYWIRNRDGSRTPVPQGQMFHLRGLSPDGVLGYNPIALARKTIATGIAAQDYGMRFFQNDARPGGWIEHPTNFKDDEARRQWRERWQSQQTGENRGKVAVLEYGLKFHEVGMHNDDAQFIDTRLYFTDVNPFVYRGVMGKCSGGAQGAAPSNAKGAFMFFNDINTSIVHVRSSTSGTAWDVDISSAALGTGGWHAVAYTRHGTTFTLWIDGVSAGTAIVSGALTEDATALAIGADHTGDAGSVLHGYIDEVRITKGTARYTSNYTP